MRANKNAGQASALAINPRNREASASRRVTLLAAFNRLDEDTRADLLEEVESLVFRAGRIDHADRADARDLYRKLYAEAGWDDGRPRNPEGRPAGGAGPRGNSNPSGLPPMLGRSNVTGERLNRHWADEV